MFDTVLGRRMVFAADEYYLMAGVPFPPADAYDGFPMHEDGVGMARTFELEFDGRAGAATGTRSGFFAAVDLPANPASYTSLRATSHCGGDTPTRRLSIGPRRGAPIAILSGELGAQVIRPLADEHDIRVVPVRNDYFGGNTGVTGLLTGEDLQRVLAAEPAGHRYLLPDVALSDDDRFLDGVSVAELPRPVEVVPTDGMALRAALESGR